MAYPNIGWLTYLYAKMQLASIDNCPIHLIFLARTIRILTATLLSCKVRGSLDRGLAYPKIFASSPIKRLASLLIF